MDASAAPQIRARDGAVHRAQNRLAGRVTKERPRCPARFSASAAALRYEAEVAARKLIEAVYAAGGEPLSVHPSAPGGTITEAQAGERLGFADGVLLPGGGDLSPVHYGGAAHDSLYDMDTEQ